MPFPPVPLRSPNLCLQHFYFWPNICGGYTDQNVDFALQVKPCLECRKSSIMPVVSGDIARLLFKSNAKGASLKLGGVCLRRDYEMTKRKRETLEVSRDFCALAQWTKDRLEIVANRFKLGNAIQHRQGENVESSQRPEWNSELDFIIYTIGIDTHDVSIDRQITEMGYQLSEIQHLRASESRKWRAWRVKYANLSDDEAWELLLPHLLHHLEKNRKLQRRIDRQDTVNTILSEIQKDFEPISCVHVQSENDEWSLISVATMLNMLNSIIETVSRTEMVVSDVPGICPEIQAIIDAKTAKEAFELEIRTKNEYLARAIHIWRNELEVQLTSLLPKETRSVDIETPEYKLILGNGWGANLLDCLPVERAKLLRADSIFSVGYLGPILRMDGEGLMYYPECFQGGFKMCDKGKLHYHSAAARIAKALLCAMGAPDISYLAINTIPRRYQCGRCDDQPIFTLWKEFAQFHHYIDKAYENQVLTMYGFGSPENIDAYTFTHDVEVIHSDKPLVRLLDVPTSNPPRPVELESGQGDFMRLLCQDPDTYLAELDTPPMNH
ncbi:hypothetical protein AG1IA_02237 [Rhizoctonia solani AG-1 IA]|uniref:Uncharacterized protein n=1 Tax=Thanatephorus cucumeris (strain AG1-IA) TaxID=983506 RepID=L8X3X8_THACA|nr:hypothetical protein AG1IA_02237 [Rhizoctonia solani AG-1 IA]